MKEERNDLFSVKLLDIKSVRIPVIGLADRFVNTPRFYRIFKGYDLIFCQDSRFFPLANKIHDKFKIPYFIATHWYPTWDRIFLGNLEDRITSVMTRGSMHFALKKADGLIVPCNYIKHKIRFIYRKVPIHVQHNAVDHHKFTPPRSEKEKTKIKNQLGLDNKTVVGYIGQINPYKGIHVLLKAIRPLAKKIDDIIVTIVGGLRGGKANPEYPWLLKKIIQKEGIKNYVRFTGRVPMNELLMYYKVMDCLVLPSLYYEYQPIVLLEAMASGVPIIGSSTEGIPETIIYGKTGLIFKRGDHQDLAEKVYQIIRNRNFTNEIVKYNLDLVKSKYTWKNVTRMILEFFNKVLDTKISKRPGMPRRFPVNSR